MVLPSSDSMRLPILRLIGDGEPHGIRSVIDAVAGEFGVGESDRALLTPKTRRRKFDIYVTRCVTDLRKAAWLENDDHGIFHITDAGQAVLSKNPRRIDLKFIRASSAPFRDWEEARCGRPAGRGPAAASGGDPESDGIVAIIGVPGTRGSWTGGGGMAAHRKRGGLLRHAQDLLEGDRTLGSVSTAAFSDTLFMAAEGGGHMDLLLAFGRAVWPVIVRSIRDDMPVRGCVACGRFLRHGRNLVAGPAADEAATYHCLPQWFGISAAPSANSVLTRAIPRQSHPHNRLYARHDIPLRASVEQDAWAVNWPAQCDEDDDRAIEGIVGIIEDRAEATPDVEAALKWRSTQKFCSRVLDMP